MEEKYEVSKKLYDTFFECMEAKQNALKEKVKIGEVDARTFMQVISTLIDYCEPIIEKYRGENLDNYDLDLFKKMQELIAKTDSFNELQNSKEKYQLYSDTLILIIELDKKIEFLYDAKKAKESYMEDFKYYKTLEQSKEWKTKFDIAYNEKNIIQIENLLNEAKEDNKNEWVTYISENNDVLIGHSINKSVNGTFDDLRGKFKNQYVSCSLFTKDINDTFNDKFGYIMSPEQIVGADSNDMRILGSGNLNNIQLGTSIMVIKHPKRIIDELKIRKDKNNASGKNEKVFSEIVIDGFNPIGIFCFVKGPKEQDENYLNALKLKNACPDLELKVYDTSMNNINDKTTPTL